MCSTLWNLREPEKDDDTGGWKYEIERPQHVLDFFGLTLKGPQLRDHPQGQQQEQSEQHHLWQLSDQPPFQPGGGANRVGIFLHDSLTDIGSYRVRVFQLTPVRSASRWPVMMAAIHYPRVTGIVPILCYAHPFQRP